MSAHVEAPIDVARAMVARGAVREAEILLRGSLARGAHDGDAHFALATLERGGTLPPGPTPTLDLALVDRWIREGLLVEALALLAGVDLGGPAEEWANVLGELLAPVPAHAEEVFVTMHRELVSGGASVALTILEDRRVEGALPTWAERRLSLLRWMLLDNAEAAPDDAAPAGVAPTALAAVLRVPLAQRSLDGAHDAVREFARARPDDLDARALIPLTELLVDEMVSQLQMDLSGFQTVPVAGRPAAAMQLRMGNLDGAASVYRSLAAKQPGEVRLQQLLDAVRGLQRVLDGKPVVDRSFAPPAADRARAPRTPTMAFDDHTENESPDGTRDPTRMVENPLMVFEETTVVRESGEERLPPERHEPERHETLLDERDPRDAREPSEHEPEAEHDHDEPGEDEPGEDSATIALPREELARELARPARVTMPLGSRPPPPPDVPRSEAEMQRADDPDPTMLGEPTVVVHTIRHIGVGSSEEEPS